MILKRLLPVFLLFLCSVARAQYAGNALDFDGTDDMVVSSTVPAFFSNLASNDFTIEAWVNPRGSAFQRILFAQPSTSNFVSLGTNTGNTIYFYVIVNSTTYSIATSTSIAQNSWTHIAARWTAATNTPEVFFNGVLQPGANGGSSSTGTSGLMVVGSRPGGAQYFNGMLDEIRVWNEARTQCEIQSNMNVSITGVQANLSVNYNFNQGTAAGNNTGTTTLPDISGNAFNGTLTNFALTGATSNWVASGATLTSSGNPAAGVTTTQSATICQGSSYTFPDGSTQSNITSQVIQVSTLQTVNGCDSTITTTLNVNPSYNITESAAICNGGSYTFPDGSSQSNITAQTVYTSNLQTVDGCDSTITTTVNVNPTYALSESAVICSGGSYTFPDGSTQSNITSQAVYTSMLQTIAGCDSLITTTVDVNPTYNISESAAICYGGSYTFPDGSTQNNLTSQTVYTSNLQTTSGCDSLITTTVDVTPIYALSETITACSGTTVVFPDGSTQVVTADYSYTSALQTTTGCDSIITTNVTVPVIDNSVSQMNFTLTANATTATYQWLDCGNNYAPVANETNQSFTATTAGTYAVAVTSSGCTDTSACTLLDVGMGEQALQLISVFPNPANELLTIAFPQTTQATLQLFESSGALVRSVNVNTDNATLDLSGLANGVYHLTIRTPDGVTTRQVIRQ